MYVTDELRVIEALELAAEKAEETARLADLAAQEAVQLRAEVENRSCLQEREIQVLKRILLVVCAALIIGAFFIGGVFYVAVTNRDVLDIVKSSTTPGGKIYERNVERTNKLISEALVDEDDCRDRRIAAKLAPPADPSVPCRDQTPPDVYTSPLCSLPPNKNPCTKPAGQ